jgi:uncharacterized linocin/CFP29 family protein
MDHLRRELAPISSEAWARVDEEASRTLRHFLAGRALVDFSGPRGWTHSAESLGRLGPPVPAPAEGVVARLRTVQQLLELRTPFELALDELDAVDRGASDPDLEPLIDAARRAALAEDGVVFHGHDPAGIAGIAPTSPHEPLDITDDYNQYPGVVARAVATLRGAGIQGPYAIALGPRCYTGVIETTEHGGYPVLEHIRLILGGPVLWAPAVDGAVVMSVRGGDYELVCGQDFAIGYRSHSGESVELYIEESVTLLVRDERAAVTLRYPS